MNFRIFLNLIISQVFVTSVLAQQTTPENAPILDEVTYQKGKDTLVIRRIEEPELLAESKKVVKDNALPQEENLNLELKYQIFIISATSYGDGLTHLQIWPSHRGQKSALSAWSNIDWSVLQSLLHFKDGNTGYQFMLFHTRGDQEMKLKSNAPELPDFKQVGARYTSASEENIEDSTTLDFLEAVHALYDTQHTELSIQRDLVLKKHEERARQLKADAKKPKTRVLRIWRHTSEETK